MLNSLFLLKVQGTMTYELDMDDRLNLQSKKREQEIHFLLLLIGIPRKVTVIHALNTVKPLTD